MCCAKLCFAQPFPEDQVNKGAAIYATNCSKCHGNRMENPQWAIDLTAFPKNQKIRFMDSVTYGIRGMPAWEDILKAEEIQALWTYVYTGGIK